MAPRHRDPAALTLRAGSLAGAVCLAAALAHAPGDWRPGLLLIWALGVALWARALCRGRADLLAPGVTLVGVEGVLGLAAVHHAAAAVALAGPALLVAAEAGFLALELPPPVPGLAATLDRAPRVAAIAFGGWLVGLLMLGGLNGPRTALDLVAVVAVVALAAGLTWALRRA